MRIPRKMEHVHHALAIGPSGYTGLEDVRLVPNAIPETSLDSISLVTRIGELTLSSPIIINAMTGGAPETEEINKGLALAARETGTAMAVGSQMSAIRNKSMRASYEIVRKMNPDGLVFGNLGSEATLEQAKEAVEMLQADALQIHLNVMQELIMPEGDRDFRGMTERIARIVEEAGVPVIVKEVGFGITREPAERLWEAGVRILDVGGTGGTNFAAIENARREDPMLWLNGWGCSTAIALAETVDVFRQGSVIATGGIRTGMDIVRAIVLGASAVGMAGVFLKALQENGTDGLIRAIREAQDETRLLMTALGTTDLPALMRAPAVITGETAEWCRARGIDLSRWAAKR
ncbi:type 2 isopentenyl-diphosphate Delta-isomerase [Gorillibacterium sp. sgz5001074]|uniref:type 2 isopentenyl-diphosphate Delta-isomerase n=1 Tax=Gorillibacterium sp. sgz5001074 TaxID=3446695 RepID=UPI003F66D05D